MKYIPSAWGREFASLDVDEALGGGSAGPGKSLALLMDPMEQVVTEHQRCVKGEVDWGRSIGWAIHLRREFPRLEQTIHRSKLLFPQLDPGCSYDASIHKWRMSSGYQISFGHLKDTDSFLNYRSSEFTHLGIDEVGEIDNKDVYDELVLRVRTTDPVLRTMLKVRCTSNPVGNWVRDYFVQPAVEGRKIIRKSIKLSDGTMAERTRMFLPALLSDNPDPEFRRQYETSLRDRPAHIRAALLEGQWFIVPGAYFAPQWDPSRVVIDPFKIPAGWKRGRALDWGFQSEAVVLWFAVSPDGEIIVYREMTFNGPKAKEKLDAFHVAHRIRDAEIAAGQGEWNRIRDGSRLMGPADHNLWSDIGQRGSITMAHDMARVGVNWQKATKGRRQAAQQVIKRLMQRGQNDRPGLMFFRGCRRCIETIPMLPTDKEDCEVPEKCNYDHWYDAVSYICAANPLPSGHEDAQRDDDDDYDDNAPKPVNRGKYGYG